MNPSAHVSSLAALSDFRSGLCTFAEEARNALITLDMEVRRAVDWLHGQLEFWKKEVRAAEDETMLARNDLVRKRMMRIGDRPPDTSEQERVLARAKQRLEHAEEKLARTRHWVQTLPDEIQEFTSPSRALADIVEADLPKVVALLERKIESLEAYAS